MPQLDYSAARSLQLHEDVADRLEPSALVQVKGRATMRVRLDEHNSSDAEAAQVLVEDGATEFPFASGVMAHSSECAA